MKQGREFVLLSVCAFGLLLLLSSPVRAEGVSGLVTDEQGGILPGVTVTIENRETGVVRTALTNDAGRYDATALPPGTYQVSAAQPGFKTAVRRGVTLTVGRDLVVDLVLSIGELTEEVVVQGEAPLVDLTDAAVSGLVEGSAIRELPLNGRSWDQLITLQSGALVFRGITTSPNQGFTNQFSISGQRVTSNKFYQDGVELGGGAAIKDIPGSAAGVQLGVEAIREFRVLTSSYSPEYGKKAGGAIVTVTKSGTNQVNGSLFYVHRNSALDAKNFFARSKVPFKRHNFGGSLGGPIRQNRSFFFANYEGLREGLAFPITIVVPNAAARQGFLPERVGGPPVFIDVSSVTRPYLKLYPLANGRDFGDGTGAFEYAPTRSATENFFLGRFDHHFAGEDSLFISYSHDKAQVVTPERTPSAVGFGFLDSYRTREQRIAIEQTRIVSPQMINTFRFGFHRGRLAAGVEQVVNLDVDVLSFTPGRKTGNLLVGGLGRAGSGTGGPVDGVKNNFQWSDQVSYIRGSHSFEFGGQLQRIQFNESGEGGPGQWEFAGLREFLLGRALRFDGSFPAGTTGTLNIGLPLDTNSGNGYRQTFWALYVRDRVRWSPRLSLDLGLRYEVITSPTEVNGRFSNFPLQAVNPPFARVMGIKPVIGEKIWPTNYGAGFGPRIGLAWDPFGQGKTSLRAGFGVFYDQIDNDYRFYTRGNAPFDAGADISGRPDLFPVPWRAIDVGRVVVSVGAVDPNIDVPTVMHFNLGLERQVGVAGVFRAGYVGASGYHLIMAQQANLPIPEIVEGKLFWRAGAPIAQPLLGQSTLLMTQANSRYHAFQTEFETRYADSGWLRRLRSKFAYTFSKSIDDLSTLQASSGRNTRNQPMDSFDLKRERGLSAHHLNHLFSFNFSYDFGNLPLQGLAGGLFNQWRLNGIGTFTSGLPINIQTGFNRSRSGQGAAVDRPNLIPAGDNSPVLGGPDRYFDPSQFALPPAGFLGNLGANTLIGPGLATVDLSLARNFPVKTLSEDFNVQFRAEFFNLFNRANFGLPDVRVFTSGGNVRGAVGLVTTTSTSSRQIQFSLKMEF